MIAAIGIAFAILLPFFFDSGSGFIEDSTTALAYVVMALGLNVVVGFAGLLDLGYVAFFAIGAYTIGWFGSSFFADAEHPHRRRRAAAVAAGHPPQLPADHPDRRAPRGDRSGAILGFPTLRLRGDYIAIVTLAFGEIIGRAAINGDEGVFGIGDFNLTNGRSASTRSTSPTCRSSTSSRRSTSDPGTAPRSRSR